MIVGKDCSVTAEGQFEVIEVPCAAGLFGKDLNLHPLRGPVRQNIADLSIFLDAYGI